MNCFIHSFHLLYDFYFMNAILSGTTCRNRTIILHVLKSRLWMLHCSYVLLRAELHGEMIPRPFLLTDPNLYTDAEACMIEMIFYIFSCMTKYQFHFRTERKGQSYWWRISGTNPYSVWSSETKLFCRRIAVNWARNQLVLVPYLKRFWLNVA